MKLIAQNKKLFFDYFIEETFEAGISLTGAEVKSIKLGHVNLKDSYCSLDKGEIFLRNCFVSAYDKGFFNRDEKRPRKLLLHRAEINKLIGKVKVKGYTLAPTKIYFKDNFIKVEIALCKGKHTFDKRAAIKERDIKRETARILVGSNYK